MMSNVFLLFGFDRRLYPYYSSYLVCSLLHVLTHDPPHSNWYPLFVLITYILTPIPACSIARSDNYGDR